MAANGVDLQLYLSSVQELFAEPAADPFDPNSRYQSGIDELIGKLRLRPSELDHQSRLFIQLPQAAYSTESQPTIRAALDRYCDAKISENEQTISEMRIGNRRMTIGASIAGIALMLAALVIVRIIPELQQVSGAIAGFIGIAVWVVLWDPIYNFFYAWRPNQMDIHILKNLRECDLRVEAV